MDFASVCLLECTNDNVGLKPTYKHIGFHDDSHESIVDVTFHGTGVDILDWKVDDEEHLSDHFAILFKVDLNIDEEASAPSTLCSGFSYYKTDWHKYSHYLEQHAGMLQLSPIDSVDVLIERERSLIGLLQDAVKFSTPRRKPANRKSKDWWDDSCRKARSELKKTKRMHGSHSEEYKSSRLTYKQLIKSKKAFSFEILANNIEHDKNYLRKVKNPARMGGSLLDGDIIPEETVNRLATAYMGSEPCAMDPTEDNEGIETGLERLDPYLAQDYETPDIQVDLGDVKSLLASRRGNWNKVGGSDGLRMKHFATAPDPYLQAVALIVSASVNLGYVPVSWKHSEVCFLPKNKNLGKINGVRPISLTNVLGKITEAFILSRLQPIEDELLRSDISYGYLPNRSTIKLVNHIKRSLNRNNPWAIAALDCSNAFGEIKHSYIVDSLVRHHADPRLVMWVKGWLAHRTNSTEYLGIHTQRLSPNGIGTPQGAILSPFLFNLTCYDALVALRSSICNAYPDLAVDLLSYADDSFIIINFQKGSLGNAMDDLIQDIIQLSNGAFQPLGLIISVVKTCVLTSYESTSYVDDTICILGITISRNLTFYSHLVRVVDKCRSRISLVMRYVRKAYGLTPSAMVRIFDVSVLPVLTYGLGCYGVALAEKRSMALLDRLEISYLKAALRVPRSTPTREVLLLAGRRPLSEVLLDQLCMNFLHKKEVRDNLLTGAGKQLRNKFMKELAIRTNGNVNCDMYELKWKLDRIDIGTREKVILPPDRITSMGLASSSDNQCYRIFTDGSVSKMTKSAGAALVVFSPSVAMIKQSIMWSLPTWSSSILQCELYAIRKALSLCVGMGWRYVNIFTDSLSAMQAMCSSITKTSTASVHNWLSRCDPEVRIYWVPSHRIEVPGNLLADKLANEARVKGLPGTVCIPTSYSWNKILSLRQSCLHKRLTSSKLQVRSLLGSARQRSLLQGHFDLLPAISRVILNRSRSLGVYRYRLNPRLNSMCPLCGVIDDYQHKVLACPLIPNRPVWCRVNGTLGQFSISSDRLKSLSMICRSVEGLDLRREG